MTFVLTVILVFASTLQAQSKPTEACTREEAIRADEEASSLHNWSELYQSYEKYHQCDDGGIGEGYSDSIAHLLLEDWESVSELNRLVRRDQKFEKFVLRHIDELMSPAQAKKISENATAHCPVNAKEICHSITTRIKSSSPQQ